MVHAEHNLKIYCVFCIISFCFRGLDGKLSGGNINFDFFFVIWWLTVLKYFSTQIGFLLLLYSMKDTSISSLSDDQIIRKIILEGHTNYFEVLYTRYRSRVLDKCYSFVKNRELAEELTEDIFTRCYEKLPTFKHRSSFSSWLYSITYNHCIDYLRKKKKLHYPDWNRNYEFPDIVDETGDYEEDINYDRLLKVLELVHPEEKALILMKYQDNLSIKQISIALRISEDAAKMRLKRARTRVLYLYTEKYLKNR